MDGVEAVLVIASCARGVAVPESDLDMAVLASASVDRAAMEDAWRAREQPLTLHLDVIDGVYEPSAWDDGGGPDDFELEIGNHVAYSAAIWERGRAFADLRERWLPYYHADLRSARLTMVREACARDIDAVAFYAGRGLYFQAFDRLYKAFREFLQALFIARRIYPIAYNKWIRHQVAEMLGEADLYERLLSVLEVRPIEEVEVNAEILRSIVTDSLGT